MSSKTVRQEENRFFSYHKSPVYPNLEKMWSGEESKHDVFKFSFASAMPRETVQVEYWKNKSEGKKKLIIVLPIIGSMRYPGEHYTHVMTSWNSNTDFNVLLLEDTRKIFNLKEMRNSADETEFLQWARTAVWAIEAYVIDVRRLIDWAELQPEIDAQNIGIIGGSISASLASLIMSADHRLKAGVFDKGGGNIPEIFAKSEVPEIKKTRKIIMKKFGWSSKELEEKIAPIFLPVDPNTHAPYPDPKRILFFSARYDKWVPKSSVESFWECLGKPERIEYFTSHKHAFFLSLTPLDLHYADYKIYNHFKKNLK